MKIAKTPIVSIIIPCYNVESYVNETIDSVLNQSYQNIEVILVDDGSTDNTLKILEGYAKKHSNIKLITQKNTYYIVARQNGVKLAAGEYLLFLDADDLIAPDYIEKCCIIAENNENIDIVYSQANLFGNKNCRWELPKFNMPDFLLNNCIYVSALIRKSKFDIVGGFDTSLTQFEDWELFISLISRGSKVYQIPEVLFYYRQREDFSSVTNTADDRKRSDNMFRIYSKHYDFYLENGIYFQDLISNAANSVKRREKKIKKYQSPLTRLRYKIFKPSKYKRVYKNR